MSNQRNSSTGRFTKGNSGNPAGRPPGSRNKTTLAMEALFDGEAESIGRKAIELAKKGNTQAIRLCLDRSLPPRKERPIQLEPRPIQGPEDLPVTYQDILLAVIEGRMTPGQGESLSNILNNRFQAAETVEMLQRMQKLEESFAQLMAAVRLGNETDRRSRAEETDPPVQEATLPSASEAPPAPPKNEPGSRFDWLNK